ncbi:tRNA (guanine-N(7)-)-methyltransferase [Orbus hercynius]|uniref:tRNA (guanine-N(7)-)-methyltransferase n=1 Tax=Orbus hercynius TaxID=593135 RepID=A0A495RCS0_9GAMM|nr:tRNA (guanosine(46)-N7)-methyltransferase TrmB [Orbus hercynius]RKS85159.1 tRNA (guanine-N(7)-)-methyltransferase [Orbus hercynius]
MNQKSDIMTTELMEDGRPVRQIRSFVLRQGRLTKGQELAITQLWPTLGIDYDAAHRFDFTNVFNNAHPVTLEIGFGMGASLVEMATNMPNENFFGIEVHRPGVGACLMAAGKHNLRNLRVMCHDAVEVLHNMVSDGSLDKVQIFFPDPWHKAKHNKRRIIQPDFVQLLRQKLKPGGILHLATDWQHYAEHMLAVLQGAAGLENLSTDGSYIPRPDYRPMTKFENRGLNLGHGVWDLQFKRIE